MGRRIPVLNENTLETSILMAVYNAGDVLRLAIESILNQTDKSWELICVDDGSTNPDTGRILDEYARLDGRIKVFRQANGGFFSALQTALSHAGGEYVARIDQDDVMHPETLRYCYSHAKQCDLDFLSFRYAKWNGRAKPDVTALKPDMSEKLQVWDLKSAHACAKDYLASFVCVHVDSWSHYMRRSLAVAVPLASHTYITSLIGRIHRARRWASTLTPLYFYNTGIDGSMMHRPMSINMLIDQRRDIMALIALQSEPECKSAPNGEWKAVCQCFLLNQLKIYGNHQRRCYSRGMLSDEAYDKWMSEYATTVRQVLSNGRIPLRWIKFRQLIRYLTIVLRYRPAGLGEES